MYRHSQMTITMLLYLTANQHRPTLQVIGQIRVQQGGITSVPGDLFSLSDSDTSKDDLQLVVTRPSDIGDLVKATQGKDRVLKSGDTFSLIDLETGKIHFIHKTKHGRKGKYQVVYVYRFLFVKCYLFFHFHLIGNYCLLSEVLYFQCWYRCLTFVASL